MSKPTPRPWKFAGSGIITNNQGDEIVLNNLFDEPDALHLIKCVNMHEELVAAAKDVLKYRVTLLTNDNLLKAQVRLSRLLAKAESDE